MSQEFNRRCRTEEREACLSIGDPRLSRKRRFSEKNQTTCIFSNKPCDEGKCRFRMDAWNRMRERATE